MPVRFFRIKAIKPQLEEAQIDKEREAFFEKLKSLLIDSRLIQKIRTLVEFPREKIGGPAPFPYPEMIKTLEDLFEVLPEDFSFAPYEHPKLYLQFILFT